MARQKQKTANKRKAATGRREDAKRTTKKAAKQGRARPQPRTKQQHKSARPQPQPAAPQAANSTTTTSALHSGEDSDSPRRKLGIRGAAPWAARHAAKHAAEARARAAVPPPPGSARATIRVPMGAEQIKANISDLQNALHEIRVLRKNLAANFYDIALVLQDILNRRLYEARGFGTFEAFLDRELDLGKITSMRLVRMLDVFKREAVFEYGMERVLYVLNILEAPDKPIPLNPPTPAPAASKTPLPLRPPMPATK